MKICRKEKSPQPGIELPTTRSWVRHAHHWATQAGHNYCNLNPALHASFFFFLGGGWGGGVGVCVCVCVLGEVTRGQPNWGNMHQYREKFIVRYLASLLLIFKHNVSIHNQNQVSGSETWVNWLLVEDVDADGLLLLCSLKSIAVSELDGLFSLIHRSLIPMFQSILTWKRKYRSFWYSLHLKIFIVSPVMAHFLYK